MSIRAWLTASLLVLLPLTGSAHTGTETETTVNLSKSGISVVTRCAPELAWILLGPGAPLGQLEAAFEKAKADLEKLAPTLISLHSGEERLAPTKIRVLLEPGRHVAFVASYPSSELPLSLSAPFLSKIDVLEPAVVRFYDHTGLRRSAEPFATLEIHQPAQTAIFELGKAQLKSP